MAEREKHLAVRLLHMLSSNIPLMFIHLSTFPLIFELLMIVGAIGGSCGESDRRTLMDRETPRMAADLSILHVKHYTL